MGKRKADDDLDKVASGSTMSHAERQDLRSELFARTRSSKTGIALTLEILQSHGLLNDDMLGNSSSERKAIEAAVNRHADADTP